MKNKLVKIAALFIISASLSSCYSYTTVVGRGAQGNNTQEGINHYIIGGLIPLKTTNASQMANGNPNYTMQVRHTVLNSFLSIITFGIYTPTTTTVRQ